MCDYLPVYNPYAIRAARAESIIEMLDPGNGSGKIRRGKKLARSVLILACAKVGFLMNHCVAKKGTNQENTKGFESVLGVSHEKGILAHQSKTDFKIKTTHG